MTGRRHDECRDRNPHGLPWGRQRAAYEREGVASYWLVDPDEPSMTVLELGPDGRYAEVAQGSGDDQVVVGRPFPVTVVPSALRAGLDPD